MLCRLLLPVCLVLLAVGWFELPVAANELNGASGTEVLKGKVEFDGRPRIKEFAERVEYSGLFPCVVIYSLPRLLRVAKSERMRLVVWKRMQRQELRMVRRKLLRKIEEIAAESNMPLL